MTGPPEPWKSDPIIREAVKSEAIEIIQRSGAVSFVALTVSDDFNAFKAEKEAQGFEVPNAYVFTALKFVVQIHGWHSDNRMAQPSEFIFEAGDPGQKRILGEILKDYGLPEPIFRKKSDQDDQHAIVALEAADFLGYEMLRAWKDTLRLGVTQRPYLESFSRMEHKWTSVTKDLMDLLLPISAAQHHLERIVKEGK
jgi:hypothetical protein